ncbi:hypothetical protein [Modicisalibacter sp. MOD 31.J]|uniref:hypothetical protein n=1 Tax=Modicisalibacter sp. MOD 31.J TaxID=2831897 RepID=UPI001CCBCD02|nr:hypothetical protein [Modicisalibacter sp. MOD 31.J]MBZ9574587.1 hypothetical protein [Modicisalibacter sp. MOD 31.J]
MTLQPTPIPVRLQRLNNVSTSDAAPSFDGPVIMVEVDARVGAKELHSRMIKASGWPESLDAVDIEHAAIQWVGLQAWVMDAPLLAGPGTEIDAPLSVLRTRTLTLVDEPPSTASDEASSPEPFRACFGIEVPVPSGYRVKPTGQDGWAWSADGGAAGEGSRFESHADACIAAWLHTLNRAGAQSVSAEFSSGLTGTDPGDDFPNARITHHRQEEDWEGRIAVYGDDEADAEALRERVLEALNSHAEIERKVAAYEHEIERLNGLVMKLAGEHGAVLEESVRAGGEGR